MIFCGLEMNSQFLLPHAVRPVQGCAQWGGLGGELGPLCPPAQPPLPGARRIPDESRQALAWEKGNATSASLLEAASILAYSSLPGFVVENVL